MIGTVENTEDFVIVLDVMKGKVNFCYLYQGEVKLGYYDLHQLVKFQYT